MTDNELKDECMENAEIDLGRYSNTELTQIREAMRIYADRKLKLFAISDVSNPLSCDGCKYHNTLNDELCGTCGDTYKNKAT